MLVQHELPEYQDLVSFTITCMGYSDNAYSSEGLEFDSGPMLQTLLNTKPLSGLTIVRENQKKVFEQFGDGFNRIAYIKRYLRV